MAFDELENSGSQLRETDRNWDNLSDRARRERFERYKRLGWELPENEGVLGETKKAAMGTGIDLLRSFGSTLEETTGYEGMREYFDEVKRTNHQYDPDPTYSPPSLKPSHIARTVTTGVTQSLGAVGAGLLGTAVAGPVGGAAAMGGFTFGQIYGDTVKEYRDAMPGEDEGVIKGLAFASAAGQSMLESVIGPEKVIAGFGKSFFSGALKETTRSLVKRMGVEAAKGAVTEGAEEVLQDYWNRICKGVAAKEGVQLPGWEEVRDQFMGGALPGAVLGGVAGVRNANTRTSTDQQEPARTGAADGGAAPIEGAPSTETPVPVSEETMIRSGGQTAAEAFFDELGIKHSRMTAEEQQTEGIGYVLQDGQKRIANGLFDRRTNEIKINPANEGEMFTHGHELDHWLDKNHPDLARELHVIMDSELNEAGLAENDSPIERRADMLGRILEDPDTLQRTVAIGQKNHAGFGEKFLNAVIEFSRQVMAFMKNHADLPGAEKYFNDYKKVRNTAARILAELKSRNQAEQEKIKAETPEMESEDTRTDAKGEAAAPASGTVRTPDGSMEVPARFKVIPIEAAVHSGKEGYDQRLQPRNRDTKSSEAQIRKMSGQIHPEMLLDSPTTDTGAPIVDANNQVVSGNGRVMALLRARGQNIQDYYAAVRKFAAEHGIEIPEGLKNPLLVREVGDTDLVKLAELSNRDNKLRRTDAEQAEADAKMIMDSNLLDIFNPNEDGTIITGQNMDFLREFIQRSGDDSLRNGDGSVAAGAEQRIRRAVLAAMFDGRKNARTLIQNLIENATEDGLKRQVDGVTAAIGRIMKLTSREGYRGYDLREDLARAFEALLEYKRELQIDRKRYNNIGDYLDQGALFGRDLSPDAERLTRFLGDARSAKQIRDVLNDYADHVERIDVHTDDMFGARDEGKDSLLKRLLPAEDKQAEPREQQTDAGRPAGRSSTSEGRFNQNSDTPLLSAEEDSGDFQLFSETPKEAAKREQAAKKAEADKLERAKAEARRNAPELPFSRDEKSDPYARIRETKEGSAERVKAFMELPDGEHELGGKKFSKQGMVFQRDGQQLSARGIEKSFRGVDVGNAKSTRGRSYTPAEEAEVYAELKKREENDPEKPQFRLPDDKTVEELIREDIIGRLWEKKSMPEITLEKSVWLNHLRYLKSMTSEEVAYHDDMVKEDLNGRGETPKTKTETTTGGNTRETGNAEVPKNYKEFDENGNWKITGEKNLGQLLDEFIAALKNKKCLKVITPKGDFHLEEFNGKFCYIDPDGRIRIWEEKSVRSVLDRFIVSNNPKIQIVEESSTDAYKARKIQQDGSLLKPGDYAVFKHKGVFYEGEVASLGEKKVKLKTQSKMYGEQVISLPRESYLGHYAQSPFTLEGKALEEFNQEYGSPEEYDNAKKSFMVQSAMRKEKPAREITSAAGKRADARTKRDVENFVGDGKQYSLQDNSNSASFEDRFNFRKAIENFKNGTLDKRIPIAVVSETPPILRKLNLLDKDMRVFNRKITIPYSVIEKAIGEKVSTSTGEGHNISPATIEQLPDAIYNPVMVLDSNTEKSLEIYVELADQNNKPIMIALRLDQKIEREGKRKSEYLVNAIRSIYGKDNINTPINRLLEGHGRYVNMQKGKSWFAAFGVQFPGASKIQLHSPYTIIDDEKKVNPDSAKNPENLKNPDIQYSVSPVYTGSAADYDQPSLHYIGTGEGAQVYGWGLYGSSNEDVARWYAEKDVQHKRHPDVIWDGKPSDKFFRELRRDGLRETDKNRYWRLSDLNQILLDTNGDVDRVINICRKNIDLAEKFNQKDVAEENRERIKLLEEYRDRISFHEGNRPSLTVNGKKFVQGNIDEGADWEKKMHTFLFSSDGDVSKTLYQVESVLAVVKDTDDRKDLLKIRSFLTDKNNKISYDDGTTGKHNLYKQTFWPGKQENLLDWDTIIDKEQLNRIIGQLKKEGLYDRFQPSLEPGDDLYENLADFLGSPKAASEFLYRAGIDGVTYIGNTSGVRDYVAFSDKDIQVDDHIKYSLRKHKQVNPIVVNGQVQAEYADLLDNKEFTPETISEWDQKAIAWIDRQGGIEAAAELIANDTEHSDRHVATLVRRHVLNSEFASSLPDDIRMAIELKNINEGKAWGREGAARRLAALTLKSIDSVKALFRKLHEKMPDKEKVKLRNKILEQTGVDINNLPDDLVNDKSKLDAVLRAELANTSKWHDKAYEYWINAILSAPTTHSANIIGNTANALYELGPKRFAEAAVNALAKRKDAATFGEFREMWNALDFRSAWKKAKTAFDLETLTPGGKFRENAAVAIPGKLGRAVRTPGRLLIMADAFARELLIPAETAARAYREARKQGLTGDKLSSYIRQQMSNPGSTAYQAGKASAERIIFQEDPGTVLQRLIQLKASDGPGAQILKYLLPFVKTPGNILKQGIRKSPLGSLNLAWETVQAVRGKRAFDSEYLGHAAEQLIAWAAFLALGGFDDDDDARPFLTGSSAPSGSGENGFKANTVPPYSIRIGDTYYSYRRIEPLATGLAAIADAHQAIREIRNGKEITRALNDMLRKTGKMISEKSYLDSVNQAVRFLEDPDRSLATFGTNFIASWIPNGMRAALNAGRDEVGDPKSRERGEEFLKDQFQVITSRMGFTSRAPKLDLFGHPITKEQQEDSDVTDFLLRLFVPVNRTAIDEDHPGKRLILNYNATHPESQWWGSIPNYRFTHNKERYYFDNEAYHQFAAEAGKLAEKQIYNAVRHGVIHPDNPAEKDIEIMKKIFTRARKETRQKFFRKAKRW